MISNKIEPRVIYADTDAGGVVYYANYLRWFESGRREIFRDLDINYTGLEKKGFIAPVVELHCNYFYPARYDDIIIVETTITEVKDKSVKFEYRISRKKDGKLLVSGYTVNVFVDRKKMKSVPIPDYIRKKIGI